MNSFFQKFKKSCFASIIALGSLIGTAYLDAAWNPPVNVSTPGTSTVDGPVLSVNYQNNAVAVWSAPPGFFALIYASSYTFGSGWSPQVVISDQSLNQFGKPIYVSQGDPDIFINNENYAVAVWEGSQFLVDLQIDVKGVFSATRDSSGVWSPVQRISNLDIMDDDFDPENPTVAINDSGLAVCVWNEIRANTLYIMASFLPMGGSWSTPTQLDQLFNGFREDTPRVAINERGDVVAVWKKDDPIFFGKDVGAATYNASTGIWTTINIDTMQEDVGLPKTAIDEAGNAIAVWDRTNGSNFQVVSRSFVYGSGWGPLQIITTQDEIDNSHVVIDFEGTSTAIWRGIVNNVSEVYASRLTFGGTWTTPIIISTVDGENFINVGLIQKPLSVDPCGNVIAIVSSLSGDLQSITYFEGLGWQTPELIFNPGGSNDNNIGFGSCGFAIALWLTDPDAIVQAADNTHLLPPPSNFRIRSCCDHFATQKVCYNFLKWDSKNCCVLFYQLRVNGVVVATFSPGDCLIYRDLICDKTIPRTYTLTYFNIYMVESPPVSITR